MIHQHSREAYASLTDLGDRQRAVLAAIRTLGVCTDRQVMAHLGFTEPNQCRPRITELCERGFVQEIGWQRDDMTGRKVRLVEVVTR